MVEFIYHSADYRKFLDQLSQILNVPVHDNMLVFPKDVADGYLRYVKLPGGIEVNIFDFHLKQPLFFFRPGLSEDFYTLHFDEFTVPDAFSVKLGSNAVTESGAVKRTAYLTSTLMDYELVIPTGSKLRGVNILFSSGWIAHYLKLNNSSKVLSEYFNFKARELNFENINKEDEILINEIFTVDESKPLFAMTIQNRLLLLIEHFFTRLYKKSQAEYSRFRVKKEDIVAINAVQKIVSEKFGREGYDIDEMAKKVNLSPTKMKKLFKSINGMPVYEYSQQQRMKKARKLLQKGMPVKEVADMVGYQKVENFLSAYNKIYPAGN